MSDSIIIKSKKRSVLGKSVRVVRKGGFMPAVVYGVNFKPLTIEMEYSSHFKPLLNIKKDSLCDLYIDQDQPLKVKVKELQRNPLTEQIIHIDFQIV